MAFAACIRDPEHHELPAGVSPRRMGVYRELFFNTIESFLTTGFPVTRRVMGTAWQALVHDFYLRHRSKTPLFVGIAEEFLSYLETERPDTLGDPPFLLELAHYEWVELALEVAEAEPPRPPPPQAGDPLGAVFGLSPVAWPLCYRFPVHRIDAAFQPLEPPDQPTWLVVYRNAGDGVRFLEINEATFRLLEVLDSERGLTGQACLLKIARDLQYPDPAPILSFGASLLTDLDQRGVIGRG